MAQLAGQAIRAAILVPQPESAPYAAPSQGRRLSLVVGVYALVALLSLLYIAQTSLLSSEGYEVGTLESARDYWQLRNDQLGMQISEARSLQTIEREAKRLGMAPPSRIIFLPAPAASARTVEPQSRQRSPW